MRACSCMGRVQGAWQCATGSAQDWRDRDTYSRSIVTRGFSVDVMCLGEVASASCALVRPVDARLALKWYSPYVIACTSRRLASTRAKTSVSSERFVARACSSEDCQTVARFPDYRPIAGICDPARVAARPRVFGCIHAMPLTECPLGTSVSESMGLMASARGAVFQCLLTSDFMSRSHREEIVRTVPRAPLP